MANNPTTEEAINLCVAVESALAGKYHVGLTGSMLYGSRPGVKATFKDIDLIVYPGEDRGHEPMELLVLLQPVGLKFVRYAQRTEYGGTLVMGSTGMPPIKQENKNIWVMDYNGTRVDVQLRY